MAAVDDVLGGGYQAPSKPFNVINPSGIGAEQSVATLTAVGEGGRNRALQRQMHQERLQAGQQQQVQAQQFQAAEAEKDRALTLKKMEEERWADERSERLSALWMDTKMELDRLTVEGDEAIRKNEQDKIAQIMAAKAKVQEQQAALSRKIEGLELLRKARGDIFNTQALDPQGNNLGAGLLRAVMGLQAGRTTSVAGMTKKLTEALRRLPETGVQPVTPAKMEYMGGPMFGRHKPVEAVPEQVQGYDELVDVLATSVLGKAGSREQVKEKLLTLFGSLDKAASNPAEMEAARQHAADQYKALKDMGVDTEMLDNAFHFLWTGESGASGVPDVASALEVQKAEAEVPAGTQAKAAAKKGSARHAKISQMMMLLDNMMVPEAKEDGTTEMRKLLKNFGVKSSFDYYDPASKQVRSDFLDDVIQMVSTLGGAKNPLELMDKLQNFADADPSNDPQDPSLQFLKGLHPEVRRVLLDEIPKHRKLLDQKIREIGMEEWPTDTIPQLKQEQDKAVSEYNRLTLEEQEINRPKNRQVRSDIAEKQNKVYEGYKAKRDTLSKKKTVLRADEQVIPEPSSPLPSAPTPLPRPPSKAPLPKQVNYRQQAIELKKTLQARQAESGREPSKLDMASWSVSELAQWLEAQDKQGAP